MIIKIKLFDKTLPLPKIHSAGAAGIDLYARVETVIAPKDIGYIPLNIALEIPQGYWVQLVARSSTHKIGLMPANGIGVVDSDFCGDTDEYRFAAYNFTDQPVTIERGQRIAQMIIMRSEPVTLNQVDSLSGQDRGGFGTTGKEGLSFQSR